MSADPSSREPSFSASSEAASPAGTAHCEPASSVPAALPAPAPEAREPRRSSAGALLATGAPQRARVPRSRFLRRSVAWARTLAIAFLAYVALFNVSVVRGSSMTPGIHDGDRIVVDRFAYLLGHVQRGDVVVLKYPLDPSLDYIKRVIGLPGDEIVIDSGKVWVNGEILDEPYVASEDPLSRTCVRVLPAHYFVLGDNRPRSSDSREFGQVPMDYVRGRVEMRLWPLSRLGAVR